VGKSGKHHARTLARRGQAAGGCGAAATPSPIGTHAISRFYLRCHIALLILWSFSRRAAGQQGIAADAASSRC
jgi:hypothetical protein